MQPKIDGPIEIDEELKEYVMKDIIRQRYKLLDSQNFLADVVLSLKPEVTAYAKGRNVDTAATDGVNLFINPFYYCKLSDEHAMSLIMHEGAHKFLGHPWRMGDRDHYLFNIAGDHAANNLILESGQKVPEEWCCDRKYKNWTSERIYADLEKEQEKEQGKRPPEEEEGGGFFDGDPDPGSSGSEDSDSQPNSGNPKDKKMPEGEFWEATDDEGNPLTDEENRKELKKNIENISESREYRRMAGTSETASQTVAIDRVTVQSAGWEVITSQFWKGKGDFRRKKWSKLNRRIHNHSVCLPGTDKVGVDWVVIAVDVSGSIAMNELIAFFSHIEKLREETPANRITIVPFNHVILTKQILELEVGDELPKRFNIGGGTRFYPVFNWVREQGEEPDSVIIFTDLGSEEYGIPTDCPILWASSDPVYNVGAYSNKPPFGEVVEVEIV